MYTLKLSSKEFTALFYAIYITRRDYYKNDPEISAEDMADMDILLRNVRRTEYTPEED